MELLRGALRTYAWGSRTAIAEFTGRPVPAAHPEAELWFGAHPGGTAWLETENGETSLPVALAADPEGQLGPACRARFGDVLPFLVKVLAADEPLSLQAHPSAQQAVDGYLREERLGIPVSSPLRNYRDTSHKPELLVALQEFEALAGFRHAARTSELLRALAVSDLDPFIELLGDQSDADGLRALFTTWITAPQPDIDGLVPAVLDGAIQYGWHQPVDVGLGCGDPGGEQGTQAVGVRLIAKQFDERVEVGDRQRPQQFAGAGRVTETGQCLEFLQRHQQLGLVTGIAIVAQRGGHRDTQSFLTQISIDGLLGTWMGLQRQRLVGREHLDQERQHVTEPGAASGAELPLRIGGQRDRQRCFAVLRFQPGRAARVCAEPKFGLWVSGRYRAPSEFGDSGARPPCVGP